VNPKCAVSGCVADALYFNRVQSYPFCGHHCCLVGHCMKESNHQGDHLNMGETEKDVDQTLPTDAAERKAVPIASGVLDYFPNALAAVAGLSRKGNDQHNPGQPMHWAREKSTDHADCIIRHLVDRGTKDTDGIRHSAKVAWRALALLETELLAEGAKPGRNAR
jgi:hypothetical protein